MHEHSMERLQRAGQQTVEHSRLTAQRRLRQNQAKREKTEQRAQPFEDIASRNRRIFERGVELNKILNDFSTTQQNAPLHFITSPLIILKRPTEKTPDVGVVGNIARSWVLYRGSIHRYNLKIVDADQISDIERGQPKSAIHTPSLKSDSEETYGVVASNNEAYSDEIMCLAESRSPGRSFSPISAIRRHMFREHVVSRLDALEATMTMFEQAASDPDLNPQLVPFFERAEAELQEA